MKILIADDEVSFAGILKSALEIKGHKVDLAYDGEEAIYLLKTKNYDLVFFDHNMPEMTGLELVKFTKKNHPQTKIVLLTGYPTMKDSFAQQLGADYYLSKPCQLEDIERIVKETGG